MNPRDLTRLNGQSVIVKSTMPPRNPPKQLSGIIEARADAAGEPKVKIVLEFSDLTNAAARRGVIGLEAADVDRLLASERNGVYEYTTDKPIDPGPEPTGPQAVS
jgi:hypothetical protein